MPDRRKGGSSNDRAYGLLADGEWIHTAAAALQAEGHRRGPVGIESTTLKPWRHADAVTLAEDDSKRTDEIEIKRAAARTDQRHWYKHS